MKEPVQEEVEKRVKMKLDKMLKTKDVVMSK